jgi:hypothetical protein
MKFNISEGENDLIRSLLIMRYDMKKTLSENISEQKNVFKPEETFGKCIGQLTFTPYSLGIDNPNDSITKKINKWAKSIGESFSFELYRRSGWGSNRFDEVFTKCKPGKLSIGNTFQEDLDRYERDKLTLQNAPYFCYNQMSIKNKWDVPNDNETGTPNYMMSLSQTFGTYDSCKIIALLNELPKFDWDKADKEDWKNIFTGLGIGLGMAGGVATGPMATFFLLSSIAADLGLASIEFYDGDIYDAGLTLAFGLIPFFELPGLKQYTKTFLRKLHIKVLEAKVLGKYQKLTPIEKEALNNIIKNKDKIIKASNQYLKKELSSKITNEINKKGLASFVKITRAIWKSYRWKTNNPFKSLFFEIGGVWYTYDQIANMSGLENKKIDSLEFDINDPETLKVISKFTDKGTF